MSEENKDALQENQAVENELEAANNDVTSAETTSVEKEVKPAQEEQEAKTSETSTEESAEVANDKETEASDDNHNKKSEDVSFMDYIDNIPQVRKGAVIKGVIVRYDDEYAYVDIRDKSEGKISRSEFDRDPNFDLDKAIAEKNPVEVFVKNIRFTDAGKDIQLSKSRVDFVKHKEELEKAFENHEPVTIHIDRQVKDGLIGTYGSIDVYIHRTQIDNRTISDEEMAEYVGQDLEVLITQFDARRRLRVSGSRRTLITEVRKERAEELWSSIAVGDIYEGVVRNITKFGVFLDLGGVDGLIHISELSWGHIKHPSEVVNVGDVVQVYVKDFDQEQNKISLGYRKLEDDPYYNVEEKYPEGTTVSGKVVRIVNFGAFVEIGEGVDALCHISEISDRHLESPKDVLVVGQEVEAQVLESSSENRRVSISIKAVEPLNELRGAAAERQAKRDAERAKREANRPANSYVDNSSKADAPSDMEIAFQAALAEQAQGEEAVEEVEETTVEAVENEETVDAEKVVEEDTEEVEESAKVEESTEE